MMTKLTLRNLRAHKRRLVGTFLAVVFGVAFFTGVFALTATINQTFDDLFSNGNRGTDAFVRSSNKIEVSGRGPGSFTQRGHIDSSTVDTVLAVDGVKNAQPFIQGNGRIITSSGQALGNPDNGPPTFAEAWIDDPALNGWSIAEGRGPTADGEVVINRQAAKDGNVQIGDTVKVESTKPITATVVGIATYAGQDSSGGTTYAAFTVEQAERDIVGQIGQIDGVKVVADDGVSQDELVARHRAGAPRGRRGDHRRRLGEGAPGRHPDPVPGLLQHDLPDLRGDRRDRRGVQHLQHLLDHRVAADAGDGPAARHRRLPQAGHAVGDARGARRRHHRVDHRRRRRRGARAGARDR